MITPFIGLVAVAGILAVISYFVPGIPIALPVTLIAIALLFFNAR